MAPNQQQSDAVRRSLDELLDALQDAAACLYDDRFVTADANELAQAREAIKSFVRSTTPARANCERAVAEKCAEICDEVAEGLKSNGLREQSFGAIDCAGNIRLRFTLPVAVSETPASAPNGGTAQSQSSSEHQHVSPGTEVPGLYGPAYSEKDCADLLGEAVTLMLQSGDIDCRLFASSIPVEFKTQDGAPRAVVAVSARLTHEELANLFEVVEDSGIALLPHLWDKLEGMSERGGLASTAKKEGG